MCLLQELELAREKEWGKLAQMGLPAVMALIHYLYEYDEMLGLVLKFSQKDWDDIDLITVALGKIGKPFIKEIINEYNSIPKENRLVRCNLADALVEIGDKQAVEPLIQSLQYIEGPSRIISALAKLGGVRAVESLIDALKSPYHEIQTAAAKALGQIGDKRAVEPLIALLNNDLEMCVCAQAALSLGELGDPRAIRHIKNALANKNFIFTDEDWVDHPSPAVQAYKEALIKLSGGS